MDEVFVISRIIKVEVGVNSAESLTETLIILDITKTESTNIDFTYSEQKKNGSHIFASSLTTLSVLDSQMTSQALISKIQCTLSANQKRDSEFNV